MEENNEEVKQEEVKTEETSKNEGIKNEAKETFKQAKEQMKDITETNTQNNPNKILIPT